MNMIRQNYLSVIIGVLVVIVAASFLITPSKNSEGERQSILDKILQRGEETGPTEEEATTYTVKDGDHLWSIAEERYGSGYNWVDIAEANNIENPDGIEIGMELTLPDVASKAPTTGTTMEEGASTEAVTITGDSYVVASGDSLWSIAVAAYGDGYQWSKIASVNNIKNPNWIEIGTTLKLPRE